MKTEVTNFNLKKPRLYYRNPRRSMIYTRTLQGDFVRSTLVSLPEKTVAITVFHYKK